MGERILNWRPGDPHYEAVKLVVGAWSEMNRQDAWDANEDVRKSGRRRRDFRTARLDQATSDNFNCGPLRDCLSQIGHRPRAQLRGGEFA